MKLKSKTSPGAAAKTEAEAEAETKAETEEAAAVAEAYPLSVDTFEHNGQTYLSLDDIRASRCNEHFFSVSGHGNRPYLRNIPDRERNVVWVTPTGKLSTSTSTTKNKPYVRRDYANACIISPITIEAEPAPEDPAPEAQSPEAAALENHPAPDGTAESAESAMAHPSIGEPSDIPLIDVERESDGLYLRVRDIDRARSIIQRYEDDHRIAILNAQHEIKNLQHENELQKLKYENEILTLRLQQYERLE